MPNQHADRRTQDAALISVGTVHLVGAGPGDPGLLTVRAESLLRRCDCVVHDYLVNPVILALIPEHVHRVYVGKRGHADSISQDEINAELVRCAQQFRCVVRLKGGDPFLFGRGGEEADHLATAGVPFTIVPGVTSGIAVPAYAGVPITHRAKSSAVVFATGHRKPGAEDDAHWRALAHIETIVLYMGMQKLPELSAALIAHGRAPETPACVIQWGTYTRQRTCTGTLADIAARAQAAGIGAPAITVIGDVCSYRDRIRWFDARPLSGRRVLVTRARTQASALAEELEALGADVVSHPLAHQGDPEDWTPFDSAMRDRNWQWIAFSSANAVERCWQRITTLGFDARHFANCRVAAVGPTTATALLAHGLRADLVADPASGEALAQAMLAAGAESTQVLLPQADNASPTLATALAAGGAQVRAVIAYRTIADTDVPADLLNDIDAITLASSATAERLVAACGRERLDAAIAKGCRCFAIGPETARGMARVGLPVHAMADHASVEALARIVATTLGPADT